MAQAAKGLGKGLSALMGDNMPTSISASAAAPKEPTNTLPISALVAGKYQPRQHFEAHALTELTESIEKHGIMQPLVVRELKAGSYEIIAGERRYRAAKLAKLKEVPVIIRSVTDAQALELALIENIQRADLNPLEEAAGYQRLMDEFGYTQEKLVPVVGKSRSHIANLLRLLKLPASIKARIDSGELTMGHARALLVAKNPEELAKQIAESGLSVRQAEELAKGTPLAEVTSMLPKPLGNAQAKKPGAGGKTRGKGQSDDVAQLESMLAENLGLPVGIKTRGPQSGEVVITYESLTQLDEILRRLGGGI